jgi:hypothetical protein
MRIFQLPSLKYRSGPPMAVIRSLLNESNTIKNGRLRPRLIDLGIADAASIDIGIFSTNLPNYTISL